MCVHDAEHLFKVISYVKYEFKFFLVLKFHTDWWLVGRQLVHVVGGWLVGRCSVVGGRLVGGFKEIPFMLVFYLSQQVKERFFCVMTWLNKAV